MPAVPIPVRITVPIPDPISQPAVMLMAGTAAVLPLRTLV